jgi:hypothetical protein
MASWKWQAEKDTCSAETDVNRSAAPFLLYFYIFVRNSSILQEFHFLFFGYKVTKNNGGERKGDETFPCCCAIIADAIRIFLEQEEEEEYARNYMENV